ncbi:MAG: thioredoxin [Cytophagales bacterium]|nr:thioredoxin [Bernardetiaceae bacterium]MDW8205214.1 thioredoxin [Cytophagales bacterium]
MKRLVLFYLTAFALTSTACEAQNRAGGESLDAVAFQQKMANTANYIVLDVRTKGEFIKGHLANASCMDYNDDKFPEMVAHLDKNKTYFVYCLSGGRSTAAANYMRKNGFKEVYDLKGGILAWQKNNFPVEVPQVAAQDKISRQEYEKMLSSSKVVLVDFYAPWCAPCKQMEPILDDLAKKYNESVKIIRINIDENRNLAKELQVEEIPVLKVFKNGQQTWHHKGLANKAEIEKAL